MICDEAKLRQILSADEAILSALTYEANALSINYSDEAILSVLAYKYNALNINYTIEACTIESISLRS